MRGIVWEIGVAVSLCAGLWLAVGAKDAGKKGAGPAAAGSEQLGNVHFPNSCSTEAQAPLLRGLALLHSFQYMESEKTFTEAAKADSKCAMAHWGKAMALYHQLWDFPEKGTLKDGLASVEKAQKIGTRTQRERGYIAAAAAFYRDDAKMSHSERMEAYSEALDRLRKRKREDVDASAFYALSLVALAEDEIDDPGNRRKAIDLLTPLFREHPDHPGVAHYLIHAADKPELASEGLAAARRYAQIAPDSSHALHMPSHIFTRLGLWQESIASNLAASAAAAHASEMQQSESHYQTHAMDFLDYAYLQTGQEAEARKLAEEEMNVLGSGEKDKAEHRAAVEARNALELHCWKDAAELPVRAGRRHKDDVTYWAAAIGAARSGDVAKAQSNVKKLEEAVKDRESESHDTGYKVSAERATDLREAEAWLAYAQGDFERAVKELSAAAEQEENKGLESTTVPAREMLADLFMEIKKPREALEAYKAVLVEAPNRFDGLLGAARASVAIGDAAAARDYFAKLAAIADKSADRVELAEARNYLEKGTTAQVGGGARREK